MIHTAEYYLSFGDNDLMIVDEGHKNPCNSSFPGNFGDPDVNVNNVQ